MKSIILFFLIVTLFSCSTKETPDMRGTYLMQSQTLNDGSEDTRLTDLKQLKIYTDSFFMYTQVNPEDSVSAFGVGSYTPVEGGVTEDVIYSASGTTVGTPNRYELAIDKYHEGYKQIIPEIMIDSVKNKLTEEYQDVSTETKTPLDGLWKETKSYVIRGADSVLNDRTQYKSYYRGYFMFGQSIKDTASASRIRVGIGFGTFEWKSDTQIVEIDLNSTYSILVGTPFNVAIEMDGPDKYKQTLANADSSTGVEYYERLKK